jgi:hypothetical protein
MSFFGSFFNSTNESTNSTNSNALNDTSLPASQSGDALSTWLSTYNQSRQSFISTSYNKLTGENDTLLPTSTNNAAPLPSTASTSSTSSFPNITKYFTSSSSTASTPSTTSSLSSSLPSSFSSLADVSCFGLSWHQRLLMFFLFLFAGILMTFLAFSFLSLLLLGNVTKFSFAYLFANIFYFFSTSFLIGIQSQFSSLFIPQRRLVAISYFTFLFFAFFSIWTAQSILILAPVLIIQIISLIALVVSYIPYGLPMMTRAFWGTMSFGRRMFW